MKRRQRHENVKYSHKLSLVAVVACLLLFMTSKFSRPDDATKAAQALPTSAQLSGFINYKAKAGKRGGSHMSAKRKSDGLTVRVSVLTLSSEAEAKKICDRLTFPPIGRMPQTSPSGRKIGEQVWMSSYPKGNQFNGAFTLISRDEKSIVIIDLMSQITRGGDGNLSGRVLNMFDLRFSEDLAINSLTKLKKMGLTSGGPVVQAAPMAAKSPTKR